MFSNPNCDTTMCPVQSCTLGSTWGKVKSAWVCTKCAREASTSLCTLCKQGKKAAEFCRRRRRMTKMTTWTCSWDVTKMGWKLELKHLFVTLIGLGGACCDCHVPPAVTQLWRPSCKQQKGMARTTQRPLTIRWARTDSSYHIISIAVSWMYDFFFETMSLNTVLLICCNAYRK